jgi:hypothetical protein
VRRNILLVARFDQAALTIFNEKLLRNKRFNEFYTHEIRFETSLFPQIRSVLMCLVALLRIYDLALGKQTQMGKIVQYQAKQHATKTKNSPIHFKKSSLTHLILRLPIPRLLKSLNLREPTNITRKDPLGAFGYASC